LDEGGIAWLAGSAALVVAMAARSAVRSLAVFSRSRLEEICSRRGREDRLGEILRHDEAVAVAADSLGVLAVAVLLILAGSGLRDFLVPGVEPLGAIAFTARLLGVLVGLGGGLLATLVWIPRSIARVWAEPFLFHFWPVLEALRKVLAPLLAVANAWDLIVGRLAGRTAENEGEFFEEEIRTVFNEGEREGLLEEDEREMIESVIDLHDADVAEIMTPRTDMVTIPADASLEEARKIILEAGHSRIPVHGETRDDIIGILYAKDLLPYLGTSDQPRPRLEEVVREPLYVPETKSVAALLQEFKAERVHMAVVLDEYGGVAGLVTIEDILEEIVGEIVDEFDKAVEEPLRQLGPGVAEIDARMHVDELNEALDLNLPEDADFDTVGGFVFSALGRIPEAGEQFTRDNVRFTILDVGKRAIERIRVEVQQESGDRQVERAS